MVQLLIELGLAPVLAALATLTGRRFGARAGGAVAGHRARDGRVRRLL